MATGRRPTGSDSSISRTGGRSTISRSACARADPEPVSGVGRLTPYLRRFRPCPCRCADPTPASTSSRSATDAPARAPDVPVAARRRTAAPPLAEAFGAALDPTHVEVFAVTDVAPMGLRAYLVQAHDIPAATLDADAARLDALEGDVVVLAPRAVEGISHWIRRRGSPISAATPRRRWTMRRATCPPPSRTAEPRHPRPRPSLPSRPARSARSSSRGWRWRRSSSSS